MIEPNRKGEVWIYAEQEDEHLSDTSVEMCSKARELADGLGVAVGAVLVGWNVRELSYRLIAHGVEHVYCVNDTRLEYYRTLPYARVLCQLIAKYKPQIVLYGATPLGRDLAPRIASEMRAGLTADASFAAFVLPQLVMGIGMGTFFVAMISILLDGLPPERVPSASGVSNFLRIIAGAFATSITTTFWDRHEALHQTRLAESSSAYSPNLQDAINGLQALGVGNDHAAVGVLSQGLVHQAYLLSSLDYFWISGWLTVAPLLLVWLARRPRGAAVAAAE